MRINAVSDVYNYFFFHSRMSFQAERESSDAQQALQTFWQKQIQEVRTADGRVDLRTVGLRRTVFELGPISERYFDYP